MVSDLARRLRRVADRGQPRGYVVAHQTREESETDALHAALGPRPWPRNVLLVQEVGTDDGAPVTYAGGWRPALRVQVRRFSR